jgi:DNA-binding MarR family transcriptional regulator
MSKVHLLRSVQRLASALAKMERQAAASAGVSVSQMRILLTLEAGEMRISDLAQDQGLAVSTMTRNLELLERRGWISRMPGAGDRRTKLVELTQQGRQLAGRLSDTKVARLSQAFSRFHPSDRVERAVALDRVAAALERMSP